MIDEVSRYSYFCQFRSTIRISRKHLIVGIDIAKNKNHAFFGTAYGKTLWKRLLFSNDRKGYMRLIEQVNALISQHQLELVIFGMEPTGNYHKPLANWLIKSGYEVVLVGGKAVKDNRQLLDGRWDKNDSKDSANVADLIGQAKCQFYEYPEDDLIGLRNLLSLRKRLKKEEHRLRMQIRNSLLTKYFPEADCYLKNCADEDLAVIRWYLDPRKIVSTDFKEFVKHVTTKDRGDRQVQRLRKIYDLAETSVGLPVNSATVFEAQMTVDRIRKVRQEVSQVMAEMKAVCENLYGYSLLQTIPGFGPYISALVLATIGNPFRFKSRKQVIRLAGLDLNANRSGKTSTDSVPVISKKGDTDLRYGLYQAGLVASNCNEIFRRLFHDMIDGRHGERGIRTKMRVKLAAKLLVIAWTMLKNNETFNPSYLMTD
ncbi:MAG: IS110 family transposase [Proteobacteria bacterium]|nr:IS110 family transposase [Pseudomonadota bacterium]